MDATKKDMQERVGQLVSIAKKFFSKNIKVYLNNILIVVKKIHKNRRKIHKIRDRWL